MVEEKITKENLLLRPRHIQVTQELNINTIDSHFYLLLDERREIRWGKVRILANNLNKGIHFESPLVTNDIGDNRRILDGNHRIEALKIFFSKNPDARVIVNVAKYFNLTREEEREVIDFWNGGTKQSGVDYLVNYYKAIPYGEQILRELPVALKKSEKNISVILLVGNYINVKKQNLFEGGYSRGGKRMVDDFMTIVPSDIKVMKAFMKDMIEIFGEPLKKSKYWRTSVVPVFLRIWYDNLDINPNKLKSAFKHIYKNWDAQWENDAKKGGMVACSSLYRDMIIVLQTQRKACKIKSDRDLFKPNNIF